MASKRKRSKSPSFSTSRPHTLAAALRTKSLAWSRGLLTDLICRPLRCSTARRARVKLCSSVLMTASWFGSRPGPRARAVPGSGDSAVLAGLEEAPARDDLAARLEAEYDRELLELASARVRARVEPQTWESFRLTALEGRPGAEAAATLGLRPTAVF